MTASPRFGPAKRGLRSALRRRIASFGHAGAGIAHMVATQPHARIHLAAVAVVVGTGLRLAIPIEDWIAVTLASALVLAAEAINTAFEHLCDVVSPQWSEDVRRAKDVAAGAVLLAAVAAAIVGGLVVAKAVA